MSVGKTAYYHDNSPIALLGLRCCQISGERDPDLFVLLSAIIAINHLFIYFTPSAITPLLQPRTPQNRLHQLPIKRHDLKKKSMASSAKPKHRQSWVLPNTVRECILFMSRWDMGVGGSRKAASLTQTPWWLICPSRSPDRLPVIPARWSLSHQKTIGDAQ